VAGDDDNDGIPNSVESNEARNPQVKDNDVFGNAHLFAMQQYRDFLGREGDLGGIQYYVDLVSGGQASREQVISSFLSSPEFLNGIPNITRLYFAYFNRIPDYGGLLFQVGAYRAGVPLADIAQNFYNAPEFTSLYGSSLTDDEYINLVYQNVLHRAPDQGGFDYYKQRLMNGQLTRGQMMLGFSESPENQALMANVSYTVGMYVGLLRRVPDVPGLAFYTNLLDNGTPPANIVPGFFNSTEYRARFLP